MIISQFLTLIFNQAVLGTEMVEFVSEGQLSVVVDSSGGKPPTFLCFFWVFTHRGSGDVGAPR